MSNETNIEIRDLLLRVEYLEKQLNPDGIAKLVDRSKISVGVIRCWLQILAIILTVISVWLAIFGVRTVNDIVQKQKELDYFGTQIRSYGNVFNNVAGNNSDLLDDREEFILYLSAYELNKKGGIVNRNLADSYFKMHNFDKAHAHYNIAYKSDELMPWDTQYILGQIKTCEEHLQKTQ